MRTVKTLIRLGGCPGWSESSLGAESFCWFCHKAVQILLIFCNLDVQKQPLDDNRISWVSLAHGIFIYSTARCTVYKCAMSQKKMTFNVCDQARLKLICLQLQRLIRVFEFLTWILSTKQLTKAIIRLGGCVGWSTPSLYVQQRCRSACPSCTYGLLRNEPPHDKTNKMACAPSEDSDQPGHLPSLISLCCPHEEILGP